MAKRWVAVEEDDENSCEPCETIDGTTYSNREDAYKDYPGGVGYKDCIGAQYGNACRGKVVKRRGKASNVKDRTEIYASLNGLLAQRPSKDPKRVPKNATKGKDWCRFENLGTDQASIFIYNEIGFWGTTADDFVMQLNAITAPKIVVHINSEGGEVWDGLAIHEALAMHPAHVTTRIDGLAASAASFIAMAGDDIECARNGFLMLHDAAGMTFGNATLHRGTADLLDKITLNIADIYAMQAGGTAEEWFAAIDNKEIWYTGSEALAAGLVDRISEVESPAAPSNMLSMMFFQYSSRAEAPEPPSLPTTEEIEAAEGPVEERKSPEILERESLQYEADQALAFLAAKIRS